MSGDRLLLDTNAVIALLQGEPCLIAMTAAAEWIGTSITNFGKLIFAPGSKR